MKAEVLVTGANGFLGRHLLGALNVGGVHSAALVREPKDWPKEWQREVGEVALLGGTPLDPSHWQEQAAQLSIHTIVHTAGVVRHSRVDTDEMMQVNIEGTLRTIRAAKAIGARVVFVSSSGTVGCYRQASLTADEHAPFAHAVAGRWPYYVSKIRAEREGAHLAEKLGVGFSVVRLPVLLGPRDHRFRSTGHVTRVLDNRVPFVPSGGMHFTDVRDVASALVRLTQLKSPRSAYHFPGTTSSLGEFFNMVTEVSGVAITERQAPSLLLNGVAQLTQQLVKRNVRLPHWLPDPVVLEMAACHWGLTSLWTAAELDYAPRLPRQTLSDTVSWLRQNREDSHAPRHAA